MKTKEYYTNDHTLDMTNAIPDPEYDDPQKEWDRLTNEMERLEKEWQKVYKNRKQFEESLEDIERRKLDESF